MYEEILTKYNPEKENLIYILHEIQNSHPQSYVPKDAIEAVSNYLKITTSHIYGVLTFYTMFSTTPRGKNVIRLCESPPCFLKGSETILKALRNILGVKLGETTKDGFFTLELCACLGVCGNAPVMMINDEVFGDLSEERVHSIIADFRGRNK
jgi:NADH-quinone oxidoreductase E subunit